MARTVLGTKSSTSNTRASGATGGTPGGVRATGSKPGMKMNAGDEVYLWAMVLIEILVMTFLRNNFRQHHGG
jgi:hypothetical protein